MMFLSNSCHPVRKTAGFSLVELLVAMLLGLFLVTAVTGMLISNKEVYRVNENLARMQEASRIVNELMAREIRNAGASPCGVPLVANVLNNRNTDWWANWDAGVVTGFDGGEDGAPKSFGTGVAERVAGTDAFIVRAAGMLGNVVLTAHDAGAARLSVNTGNHGLDTGDIIMVCDYTTAAITQVTGSQPRSIRHQAGVGTPGNCSKGLGYPTPDPCNTTPSGTNLKSFNGGFVTPLIAAFWYVGNNASGGKSLYRMAMDGDPGSIRPVEIWQNVEDLQVTYLLRDGATLESDYVDASAIADWSDSAAKKVAAMRVILTLSSNDKNVGTERTALQRLLINSVSLRNREIVE